MNSEKWEQAKRLYEAALKIGRDERPRFLAENCEGDEELHEEVESLLAASDEASDFLEQPAIGQLAEEIVAQRSLIGRTIHRYKIIELLGAGGMGEVYLAEDTRLKRKIALKILPASLGVDLKFVRRFEQEAYAASALNHPNILTVHEFGEKDGMNFIASEFVTGETLRERLNGGKAMSFSEILDIALQVAAALNAAHSSGIVHRDIKPENVMIRDDGLVKVLDFGLAKLTEDKSDPVDSKIETWVNTTPGMIMGTAVYMSPEQARGRKTDARTDIWSLGIMLYEMLDGRPPFKGETASDIMASILVREPPMLDSMPAELARILQKALQKDASERYQAVKDFIVDLDTFRHTTDFEGGSIDGNRITFRGSETLQNRPASNTDPLARKGFRFARWKVIFVFGLFSIAAAAFAVWKFFPLDRFQAPTQNILFSLSISSLFEWPAEAGESDMAARFSPNGTMIAYVLTEDGQSNIYTRQIPSGRANKITNGNGDYSSPVWSPDSQQIAFIFNKENQPAILTVPFSGGEYTYIRAAKSAHSSLLSWNGEKIYFQDGDSNTGLNVFALDLASKDFTPITHFDSADQAQFFSISPDESRIAYSAGPDDHLRIFVVPIGGGTPKPVTNDKAASDEYPFWLPDGKGIVYSSKKGGIFQPCIVYPEEGRMDQLNLSVNDTIISDVARVGGRILLQQTREEANLWKIDIDGKNEMQITSETGLELWPDVSPDGKDIVYQATTESKHLLEGSVFKHSIGEKQQMNIVANGFSPAFSPDGENIAFLRDAGAHFDLCIIGKNGPPERKLTSGGIWFSGYSPVPYDRVQRDFSWSPDGASLIYCAEKGGLWNVWQLAADGSGELRQISDNTDKDTVLLGPAFSADGTHIAWTSTNGQGMNLDLWYGGRATRLHFDSIVKPIGWAGNSLVIAQPGGSATEKPVNVLFSLVTDDRRKDLASVDAAYFNNIQLSPDGRRVAVAIREKGKNNILIISLPSGDKTGITATLDPVTYISGITWSPDSKSVYFSKQKQVGNLFMIENFK